MDWTKTLYIGLGRIQQAELTAPAGKKDQYLLRRIRIARRYLVGRLKRK